MNNVNEIIIDCQSLTWLQLRNLILLRDNNTCQDCGKKGIRTHVHHVDFDRTNNIPANLKSLCQQCHEKCHMEKKYANGGKIPFIKKLLIDNDFTITGDIAPALGLSQSSISEFIDKIPPSFTRLNDLKKVINILLDSDYTIEELFTLVD